MKVYEFIKENKVLSAVLLIIVSILITMIPVRDLIGEVVNYPNAILLEALLLQGFPKKYADTVKKTVSDRHLLMQAGNAMTVNVITALGNSIKNFLKEV